MNITKIANAIALSDGEKVANLGLGPTTLDKLRSAGRHLMHGEMPDYTLPEQARDVAGHVADKGKSLLSGAAEAVEGRAGEAAEAARGGLRHLGLAAPQTIKEKLESLPGGIPGVAGAAGVVGAGGLAALLAARRHGKKKD